MSTIEEAARTGYTAVARGLYDYLRGLWLYFTRTVAFFVWVFVAGFVAGVLAPLHEFAGAIGGLLVFASIPVVYGYAKLAREGKGGKHE